MALLVWRFLLRVPFDAPVAHRKNSCASQAPAADERPSQWGPVNLVRDESQQP